MREKQGMTAAEFQRRCLTDQDASALLIEALRSGLDPPLLLVMLSAPGRKGGMLSAAALEEIVVRGASLRQSGFETLVQNLVSYAEKLFAPEAHLRIGQLGVEHGCADYVVERITRLAIPVEQRCSLIVAALDKGRGMDFIDIVNGFDWLDHRVVAAIVRNDLARPTPVSRVEPVPGPRKDT